MKDEILALIEHRDTCLKKAARKLRLIERYEGDARERQIERALWWSKKAKELDKQIQKKTKA